MVAKTIKVRSKVVVIKWNYLVALDLQDWWAASGQRTHMERDIQSQRHRQMDRQTDQQRHGQQVQKTERNTGSDRRWQRERGRDGRGWWAPRAVNLPCVEACCTICVETVYATHHCCRHPADTHPAPPCLGHHRAGWRHGSLCAAMKTATKTTTTATKQSGKGPGHTSVTKNRHCKYTTHNNAT